MLFPRQSSPRLGALVAIFSGLVFLLPAFAAPAPLATRPLNEVNGVVNATDNVDLTGYFKAQDATGTVVQFTLTTGGTTPNLSGTQVINLALTDDLTPVTVANFLSYVRTAAYDSSFFHRSHAQTGLNIIQGGGFLFTGTGAVVSSSNVTTVPAAAMIVNEASDTRPNTRGTISMARLGTGPNTASSQWFFNTGDNTDSLGTSNGGGYAVFGHVLGSGMDVADAIFAQPIFDFSTTINGAFSELPLSNRTSGDTSSAVTPSQLITVQSARVIPALTFTAVSENTSIVNPTVSDAGVLTLDYLTSGTTTVTVTATDLDQVVTSGSFTVGVQPETAAVVGFDSNAVTASGTDALLNVVRSGTTGAFTVEYSTFNGTAAAGTDYVATSGTLSFADSDTQQTIRIPLIAGTGSRAFTVQLSNPSNGVFLGLNPVSTVTIANPSPNGTLQFSQSSYGVQEGQDALLVQVTRTSGSAGVVSAVISTGSDGDSAITGVDYTGLTRLVSFADGDTTPKTIVIPILNRNLGSSLKVFTLSLTAPSGGAILGENAGASAIIYDQTNPDGVFAFASPEYRCSGTGAVIAVQRLNGSSGTSSVIFSTGTAGTAVVGVDYTATSGTLTFGSGETWKTFVVPVQTVAEDRTVDLQLTASGSSVIGTAGAAATLVIASASTGVIQFQNASYQFTESYSLDVTLTRTGDSSQAVSAYVELIDGSAVLGTNYSVAGANGHLVEVDFAQGSTSQTVTVTMPTGTAGDFSMQLLNTTPGGAVGAQDTTTLTAPSFFNVSPPSYLLSRSNSTAVVTVYRTGTTGGDSVSYETVDGTAVSGTDYTPEIATLTFVSGETSKDVVIPILSGNGTDPATFNFTLLSATGSSVLGAQSSIPITLVTNAPGGLYYFDADSYRFDSGNYGQVNILRSATDQAATVYVQLLDGSAKLNVDYLVSGGSTAILPVTFAAGDASAAINIAEYSGRGNKSMTLKLFNSPSGSAIGTPNTAPVSFLDTTTSNGLIEFSPASYRVSGSNGEVIATVVHSGTNAATVTYSTADGTAVSGSDYMATSGTLTFPAGVTSQDIHVPILSGTVAEVNFTVNLSNPTDGAAIGAQNTATVTVVNSAPNGIFSLDAGSYRFYAGSFFPVTVLRSGTDQAATAYVQLFDGSGKLNVDYVAYTGTDSNTRITNPIVPVTFAAGDASATIHIGGFSGRGDKTMTVKLYSGSAGSAVERPSIAPVTFIDTTNITSLIEFSRASYRVSGSNAEAIATVTRSGTGDATVAYSTADGTAVSGTDYVATSGTLTFPTGVTSREIHLPVHSGTAAEVNFSVILSNATGGAVIGVQDTATVTIVNSAPNGIFSFAEDHYSLIFDPVVGGTVTILRSITTGSATVTLQAVDGSAKLAQGQYLVNGTNNLYSTISFADGDASKTVVVKGAATAITRDFKLRLVDTSPGCAVGTPSETTVTLAANGLISFGSDSYRVPRSSGTAVIKVIRNDGSVGPVSVAYTTTRGSGAPGTDYVTTSGTLNFADGVASMDIRVPLLKTTTTEERTFNLALSNPGGGAVLSAPSAATVTIVPNPTKGVFSFNQGSYAFLSGNFQQVAVVRTGIGLVTSTNVTVQLIDGTGKLNTDYFVSSSDPAITGSGSMLTLNFAANETYKIFSIGALTGLGNKTMTLQLNVSTNAAVSPYGTAQVTFYDFTAAGNPNGLISFASPTYRVDQSVGSAFVTVERSSTIGNVTIDFATSDGTAKAGLAYSATSGTLTFPSGVGSVNVPITLLNNSATTADQSFNVTLTNPTGGADFGSPTQTVVTVVKSKPASVFKFSSSTYNLAATSANIGRFVSITRTGSLLKSGTVYVALIDGSAKLGQDYFVADSSGTALSGPVVPVVFGTNASTQVLIISAPVTSTKNLTLRLVSATAGSGIGSPDEATVTFYPQGIIQLGAPSLRFCESDSNAIVYAVRTGTSGTASVTYSTFNGPATSGIAALSGTDYVATSGTLTFLPGEVWKTITVPFMSRVGTTVPDRTFTVRLANPSDGSDIGTLNSASITIVKKPTNGIFSFSQGNYRFDGDANFHSVTVVRSTPAALAATAYVELVDDTAIFNFDYSTTTATTGTGQVIPVKFAAGQTSATFMLGENTGRGNNAMKVALVDASVGSAVGTLNTATVSFFDAGLSNTLVEVSPPVYWLGQTATGAMIRIVRTGSASSAATTAVGYTTVDGTGTGAAVSGTDYTMTSGTLTFGPGVVTQDILVPVVSGSSARDRNFSLVLTSATGGMVGSSDTATINIVKSASNGVIALSASSYTFDTDNNQFNVVTLVRSASGKPAVAYVELVNGTALSGVDFFTNGTVIGAIATSGSTTAGGVVQVNFSATQTTGTFGIGSPVGHGDKFMTVRVIGTEAGNAIGSPSSAVVQFLEINRHQGTIEFSPTTYRENQLNGQAQATVIRRTGTNTLSGAVSVVYNTVNGTALSGSDYVATTGTLQFAPGQTSQTLQVPLLKTAATVDKTFQIVLSSVLSGTGAVVSGSSDGDAILGAQSTATVTIAKSASAGVFTFGASKYVFSTGTFNSVTVARSTVGSPAMAYVQLSSGTGGILGTDYFAAPGISGSVVAVSFGASDAKATFPLRGVAGSGDKNVTATLVGVSGNGGIGALNKASIAFLDPTRPGGLIAFSPTQYRVSREGAVTVTLNYSGTNTTTVQYKFVDGTAKAGIDYAPVSGSSSITFGINNTASFTVQMLQKTASLLASKTFQIVLTGTPTGSALIQPDANQATVSIVQETNPKGVFEFDSPSYAFNRNAGWAELIVLRSSGVTGPADVTLYTADANGPGRNSSYQWPDPKGTTGLHVHFADGQDHQKVFIPLIDGSSSATFLATLSSPTAGILGYQNFATVTLRESRSLATPSVEFDATQYRANDTADNGDNGSLTLTAKLYGSSTSTITVPFQIQSGSALLNTDYVPTGGTNVVVSGTAIPIGGATLLTGTLTFPPGVTSVALPFNVYPTPYVTAEKQFTVQLMTPAGDAALLAQTTATVTIVNHAAPKGVFELQNFQDTVKVAVGVVTGTLVRSVTTGSAQIIVTTEDGSAQGLQFDGTGNFTGYGNFAANRQALLFAPGEATKTFDVQVFSGTTGKTLPANFMIRIESVPIGAAIGSQDREIVTINPPETITQTSIGFDQKSYDVDESTTFFYIPVRRADISTSGSDQLTVNYTVSNGTAISGTDHDFVILSGLAGTVTFGTSSGDVQYIIADIINRRGLQPSRTFSLQLSNPVDVTNSLNPVALLSNSNVQVTIHDIDSPYGVFEFDRSSYSAYAGDGSVTFIIVRSGDLSRSGTVGLRTADGSAAAGIDYSGIDGNVIFAPGQAYQQVSTTIRSNLTEPRYFIAELSPTATSSIGAVSKTTVNLMPPPTGPTVQYSQPSFSVEDTQIGINAPVVLYSGTVTSALINSGSSSGLYTGTDTITVTVSTVDGDATANVDYQPVVGTITLSGSSNVLTVPVSIIPTGIHPDRTFFLKLSNPVDQTNPGTKIGLRANTYVPVKIINTRYPKAGLFEFASSTYTVKKSAGSIAMTVNRNYNTAPAATVYVKVVGGTAIGGVDYVGSTNTVAPLAFVAGQKSITFTAAVIKTAPGTASKTIILQLLAPSAGSAIGTSDQTVLTITN